MSDKFEGLPKPVADMIRRDEREARIQAAQQSVREAGSARIEQEVLTDLWRDLGDHTETYWSAMTAVTAFVNIERFIHKELESLPNQTRIRLIKAVSTTILEKAGVMESLAAKRQEIMAGDPLEGDFH